MHENPAWEARRKAKEWGRANFGKSRYAPSLTTRRNAKSGKKTRIWQAENPKTRAFVVPAGLEKLGLRAG